VTELADAFLPFSAFLARELGDHCEPGARNGASSGLSLDQMIDRLQDP
jgi:hypothetical protein